MSLGITSCSLQLGHLRQLKPQTASLRRHVQNVTTPKSSNLKWIKSSSYTSHVLQRMWSHWKSFKKHVYHTIWLQTDTEGTEINSSNGNKNKWIKQQIQEINEVNTKSPQLYFCIIQFTFLWLIPQCTNLTFYLHVMHNFVCKTQGERCRN
jgi:hypothetical protein